MTVILSLSHVGMEYPSLDGTGTVQALADVNLDFADKEFVVALGASGCGKTTLLNVIAGFLQPTSGTITNLGKPVSGPGRDRGVLVATPGGLDKVGRGDDPAEPQAIERLQFGVSDDALWQIAAQTGNFERDIQFHTYSQADIRTRINTDRTDFHG